MKNITAYLFAALLLCCTRSHAAMPACTQPAIVIQNTLPMAREELISIPYNTFAAHFRIPDTVFTIVDPASGQALPHQLEKAGHPQAQQLLVLVKIAAQSTLTLHVQHAAPPKWPSRVYARAVPERFDDFAWENDRVAFRMYGRALEGRRDDAKGLDFWAKRTEKLIIDRWYRQNDYHRDHGEGLDYYTVGQTLGAGDVAFRSHDSVHYTRHYRSATLLDNGPLRVSFRLNFDPEYVDGRQLTLTKTISLDAGQAFNRIQVDVESSDENPVTLVAGIAARQEENPQIQYHASNHTLAYWEPAINDHGRTGIALLLIKPAKSTYIPQEKVQFLLQTPVMPGQAMLYYNGATWDQAGYFTTASQWFAQVDAFRQQIRTPLQVKLK